MMAIFEMIFPYLIYSLFLGIFVFMLWRAGADTPLFKMRCRDCGLKDKNWEVVPVAHQDFAWQHKCPEDENEKSG